MKKTILEFLSAGPAHAPIRNILNNVNNEIRHKRMSSQISTIWEELEHMRIAQKDILQYMINPDWKSPVWPEGYWPDKKDDLSDSEWKKSLKSFLDDLNTVANLVKQENLVLTDKIPHAPEHTYLREVMLIIDHNAYHAAKIIMIRKYFNNWPG